MIAFLRRLRRRQADPEPTGTFVCCLRARGMGSEAGYWLHRVRVHGEGSA